MKKISVLSIAFLLFVASINCKAAEGKVYKINGVKEFHRFNKEFIASSQGYKLDKLSVDDLYEMTINISRVNIFVDDLTDNDYLKDVFEAIGRYLEMLSEERGSSRVERLTSYLEDLRNDIMMQNKSDLANGTKTYKFDIGGISEDNSSNYDMKREILKKGKKTAKKFVPLLTTIDKDIIRRLNELKLKKLSLPFVSHLSVGSAKALLSFKGKGLVLNKIKFIEIDVLKILAEWGGELSLKKLKVDASNIDIISNFKSSKLEIMGLKGKYSSVLKKKMGKRFKKKIKFKKGKH